MKKKTVKNKRDYGKEKYREEWDYREEYDEEDMRLWRTTGRT